jgi:hypothetical protein
MLALSNDLPAQERMAAMIEQQGTTKTLPRRAGYRRVDRHLIDLRTNSDAASSSRCEAGGATFSRGPHQTRLPYVCICLHFEGKVAYACIRSLEPVALRSGGWLAGRVGT